MDKKEIDQLFDEYAQGCCPGTEERCMTRAEFAHAISAAFTAVQTKARLVRNAPTEGYAVRQIRRILDEARDMRGMIVDSTNIRVPRCHVERLLLLVDILKAG